MFAMAVHGGAGRWEAEAHEAAVAGVRAALALGVALLKKGMPAIEAVVAAARHLEDDPVFNAGTGAALNLRGEVECDASVMVGEGLRAGAVAAVRGVKNPILLARRVMEETDHVLVAGEGAGELAALWGLRDGNEPTAGRRRKWEEAKRALGIEDDPSTARLVALLKRHPELAASRRGTIGAVAVDARGGAAAATSTGGVTLKLAGRIGDTPLLGAGTYATAAGAASATGRGELMIRALTTRTVCDLLARGESADGAARAAVAETARSVGDDLGVIVVDRRGGIGIAHGTRYMPHAFQVEGGTPVASLAAHTPSG